MRILYALFILFVGFAFTIGSLFRPVIITERGEWAEIQLGSPFPFVFQDQSFAKEGLTYPQSTHLWSPWDNRTEASWSMALADLAIACASFHFGIVLVSKVVGRLVRCWEQGS